MRIIVDACESNPSARPMVKFYLKLKDLKKSLKAWKKELFGNAEQVAKNAEDKVFKTELEYYVLLSKYNKKMFA